MQSVSRYAHLFLKRLYHSFLWETSSHSTLKKKKKNTSNIHRYSKTGCLSFGWQAAVEIRAEVLVQTANSGKMAEHAWSVVFLWTKKSSQHELDIFIGERLHSIRGGRAWCKCAGLSTTTQQGNEEWGEMICWRFPFSRTDGAGLFG